MTVLESAASISAPGDDSRRRGFVARLWSAPLWLHAVALGILLVAMVPVVGTNASFSADGGAAIIQARSLSAGEGWIVEHPVAEVDPDNRYYPLELSERGPDGIAPFGKHPLYAVLLAGADRVGGTPAMVGLSLLGTVVAAFLAGAIGSRLGPRVARTSLWVVGVASPLWFDAHLVMAHTLGAALVAGAVLIGLVAVERRKPAIALAVAPCMGLAVLLRTEAALFGVALAIAFVVMAGRRARARLAAATVAASGLAAALGARMIEGAWTEAVVGGPGLSFGPGRPDRFGWLDGRLNAFLQTWLRPTDPAVASVGVALAVAVSCIAVGVVVARRRPADPLVGRLAVIAAAAYVAALLLKPSNLVTGLLVAFPVALAGLCAIGRASARRSPAPVLLATSALFSGAVLLTQYATGGTGEWGGRYFALAIPVATPVLVAALADLGRRLPPTTARLALVSLVVCSAAMAAMAVGELRATHRSTAKFLVAASQMASASTPEGRPVMVATEPLIPRLAWATFADQRWLLVPADEVVDVVPRLADVGIGRFILVTRNLADISEDLEAAGVGDGPPREAVGSGRWEIVVFPTA